VCTPAAIPYVVAGIGSALTIHGQNQQVKAIDKQNELQSKEISIAKGKELTENAQRAAAERSAMRAAAAESGINIQSGSFLSALQTSAITEGNNSGTIIYNEKVLQRARQAEAESAVARTGATRGVGNILRIGTSVASQYTPKGS
jgi:hypothetical protein